MAPAFRGPILFGQPSPSLRRMHHMDRHHILPRANTGESLLTQGQAMTLLNKSRADLQTTARAIRADQLASRETVDFETLVQGLPVGVHIHEYDHAEEYVNFEVVTVCGYPSKCLRARMTIRDHVRISEEAMRHIKEARREEQDEAIASYMECAQ